MNALPSLLNRRTRRPAPMAPLSVLPVFFDLHGRTAVVAGNSDAVAWKAELLAAAGASVHVYAPAPGDTLAANEQVTLHQRPWSPDDLTGAAIAVADAADEVEAEAFATAARAAGVPFNVIDKPAFCQFSFGAIVNRSPTVVGISTAGAAPVLAQAIRRRIETVLPPALAAWTQLAAKLRHRIAQASPGERRAFWQRFADRAFRNDNADAGDLFGAAPAPSGQVTLVGAGPGDAALLTLQAVRALQSADVILFDDLVSDEVLELARREAKRLLVGKRGGRESCRQQDINDMMVSLAKAGKNVVRLKSGDPMVFGRAGEEIARLDAENIPVSVVPGITAASAMASTLGVSLTHRDHAQSVRLITGHSKNGGLPTDINWPAIADPSTTTIFYMGGRTATRIADTLIGHGLTPETPVVICAAVSRATTQRWHGTLRTLPEGIAEIGYQQPVLIGVGKVFGAVVARPSSLPADQMANVG